MESDVRRLSVEGILGAGKEREKEGGSDFLIGVV